MAVTVKLPTQLRAADRRRVEVERRGRPPSARRWTGSTPSTRELRERITQDGDLRRFVNVYLYGEDIRFLEGLDDQRSPTATRSTILPAVAGG